MTPLLEVEDLHVHFRHSSLADLIRSTEGRTVRAVNGVSLTVNRGETLGLVGESGCGKSTLARALLRLVEPTSGTVRFDGADIGAMEPRALFELRRRAQMVFQDPLSALNPRMTVGETLAEVLHVHRLCPAAAIPERVAALMTTVGLSPDLADRRPATLSGGQCQRVGVARALAVGPDLIVADEAVSALDVSIQAQILNLLGRLQQEMGLTLVFISHDLGVVRHLCRTVAVMYLGRIVERGPTEALFRAPRHPYTQALLAAMPSMDPEIRLPDENLTGEPPNPAQLPSGCPFHPRCAAAMPTCRHDSPVQSEVEGAAVWCHLYDACSEKPGPAHRLTRQQARLE